MLQFFVNLRREAFSEIASLATFRTIKMNEKLAAVGDDVSNVFFVFRGECISKSSKKHQHAKRRGVQTQRYGPGHIVGWCVFAPDRRSSTITTTTTLPFAAEFAVESVLTWNSTISAGRL